MSEKNKKCLLILPYFGKFNNYFELFLKSCALNPGYNWLIFTDCKDEYNYPKNVCVVKMTLEELHKRANEKLGFEVSLDAPYKLCDYKPAYGFLFEEYIKGYEYWGNCDCDLLFGNLEKILTPLLNKGYEKLFAAGHLTIYKNSPENNRRFMKTINGRLYYKEAFQTNKIYVFDEDYQKQLNPKGGNIQDIFLEQKCKICTQDISMNISGMCGRFCRAYYDFNQRTFIREEYVPKRYYWYNGNVYVFKWNKKKKTIEREEYLYIHLQMRKMKVCKNVKDAECVQILPDRFVKASKCPHNKRDMKMWNIKFTYGYWSNYIRKKIEKYI